METWITRIALLWLDGSVLLLVALVSGGPYALALAGALLLADWPRYKRGGGATVSRASQPSRFTLR
ncbi:MAG TPA: hypothetical protein PKH77_00790 [Anaerolineae bacterium]|nr:hypothetical protein [Anaerolineae bacterium]